MRYVTKVHEQPNLERQVGCHDPYALALGQSDARYRELPAMIDRLAPRIRAFHLSDYDGIDENHWLPGQGIIDWIELMRHIRAIDHDLLLILETGDWQLKSRQRLVDPQFMIRQNEKACWYLENCERIQPEIDSFRIPGN